MGRLGIGDRLNANSKQGVIFTDEYRKVRLDPRTLVPSEHNKYAQDDIEELADNMLLVGQLQEVIVGRVNGHDRIIVGHRRTAAAVLNIERGHDNFKLIDCKVKEMTEAMFMLTLHSANIFNRRLSDWELTEGVAEFKKFLIAAKEAGEVEITGKMRDYIADAIGVSTGKMAQMESITNNLCEKGKEAFKNGDINFTTAYETSRLPVEKQKEVIESGEMLSGEVRQMVEQERQKKEPTAAAVKKFYEAHAKKYDEDRSKLKELCIEHMGRSHNGGNSGGVNFECSIRGVKLENAEEITWTRFVQLVNEYYPVAEEPKPGDDYEPAHPESITSLCYSCKHYSECNVKTGTCEKCDKYINKAEAEKTDEQRYSEEQDRIDRETKAKLKEQADAEKMKHLPSETAAGQKVHSIRLAKTYFNDVASGKKSFELRKNNRGYKVGDILEMLEFEDGKNTGRIIQAEITYILEGYTGLEDGYCILGIKVKNVDAEKYIIPGQMSVQDFKGVCNN